MSEAEKMFNELGYEKTSYKDVISYWRYWGNYEEQSGFEEWASFYFYLDDKTFSAGGSYESKSITIDEHKAVIQQIKELGWLDD